VKLPSKTVEQKLLTQYDHVIGVDEVGMGCLAGPVVVCAVSFNKEFFKKNNPKFNRLRESKLLLPHQREKFANELVKEKSLRFKIAYCYSKTIDKINIYQAARLAMRKAIAKLNQELGIRNNEKKKSENPDSRFIIHNSKIAVLIDGPSKINGLSEKIYQVPIIKGDQKVFTIACASILAKVYRDKMMTKYSKKFPKYGFEKHKGYGTKDHLAKLAKFGPCAIHRQSFAPVGKLI